jgi:hypothetical protein
MSPEWSLPLRSSEQNYVRLLNFLHSSYTEPFQASDVPWETYDLGPLLYLFLKIKYLTFCIIKTLIYINKSEKDRESLKWLKSHDV